MPELILSGCRAEPLGSYLKALGILRLVAEQLDPEVAGRWDGDVFVIDTGVDRDRLIAFFLNDYRPTPVIAPWNGRVLTGLLKGDAVLSRIEGSDSPRLEDIRRVIQSSRLIATEALQRNLLENTGKKKDRLGVKGTSKNTFISICRNRLPDSALLWLDSTVVLTNPKPQFPLLTGGSGGNLGSGDLSINYLSRLARLFSSDSSANTTRKTRTELAHALFGDGRPALSREMVGMFDPGGAGGEGVGDTLVNPWDFLLLVEGTLLFAGGTARRMGFDQGGKSAMPFTVQATLAGFGSAADGETTKGEVWTPIWRRPTHLREVRQLLAEGRATWAHRQSRTAVDFARAVGSLGVDRGIDQFVRHSIGQRYGQMDLAVPVGRVDVRERAGLPVLQQLDRWLGSVRNLSAMPTGIARQLRRVDQAIFEVATKATSANFQELLVAVSDLDRAIARSGQTREQVRPVSRLSSTDWLPLLDDHSIEFSLARGFASLREGSNESASHSALRAMIEPVHTSTKGGLEWTEATAPVDGIGARPILEVLGRCAARRAIEAQRGDDDKATTGPGVVIGFDYAEPVPIGVARSFYAGSFDLSRFEHLLLALMCLDWARTSISPSKSAFLRILHPPAFSVLAPFGHSRPIAHDRLGEIRLAADRRWPAMLLANKTEQVLSEALRRLSIVHLSPPPVSPSVMAIGVDPAHLAASLLLPLFPQGVVSLLDDTTAQPVVEDD